MLALAVVALITCGPSSTQLDLDWCAAQKLVQADAAERRAYVAAAKRTGDPSELRVAERRWQAARDAACAYTDAGVAGGSMLPMLDAQCRAASAIVRARVLQGFTGRPNASGAAPSPDAVAEHDRVYGLLELLITPQERSLLAKSEYAWLAYRRAACEAAADTCATDLTRARTQELKDSWLADPFWIVLLFQSPRRGVDVLVRFAGSSHSPERFHFPVDGGLQDAVCRLPVELHAESRESFTVADGACDSIHFSWNRLTRRIDWWRN